MTLRTSIGVGGKLMAQNLIIYLKKIGGVLFPSSSCFHSLSEKNIKKLKKEKRFSPFLIEHTHTKIFYTYMYKRMLHINIYYSHEHQQAAWVN
jgi:hypothetical protein